MPRLLSLFIAFAGLCLTATLALAQPAPFAPPPLTPENTWNLDLSTGGRVVIQLRPDAAPAHVERIKALTRQGFYNGLTFFRVIEGFMAQGGDPQNSGLGGSTLPNLNAELNALPHVRGALGMARAQDMNSANSQFYIMFAPKLQMDRQYTIFGRVVSGMNFVDAIERGEPPPAPSRIVRASLGTDNVAPMSADELRAAAAQLATAQGPAAVRMPGPVGPAEPPPMAGPRPLEPIRAPNAPPRPRRPPPQN
jgi:cyclophilin family peptidyl-prolyl cis-trans isomerase